MSHPDRWLRRPTLAEIQRAKANPINDPTTGQLSRDVGALAAAARRPAVVELDKTSGEILIYDPPEQR